MKFKKLLSLIIFLSLGLSSTFGQLCNRCLDFDGRDDYADARSPLNGDVDFTFETWVRIDNQGAGNCNTIGNLHRLISWQNLNFEIGECGGSLMVVDRSAAPFPGLLTGLPAMPIDDGNWHHFAFTKNGSAATVYLDGNKVVNYQTSNQSTTFDLSRNFRLGLPAAGIGGAWDGQMDEMRLWDYARSEDELNQTLNCELKGDESGLVLYYPFNQGEPGGNNVGVGVLDDITSFNNDAELIQFLLEGNNSNWLCSEAPIDEPCASGGGCMAAFEFISDDCGQVEFINQSTGNGLSYLWDFGDGNTSTDANPTHMYASAGTYMVCLTISEPNCEDQICHDVRVTVDNEAPLLICPASILAQTDPGRCDAQVMIAGTTVTDNCDATLRITYARSDGLTLGDPFPKGTTNVVCSAIDNAGNLGQCEFTVTVNDFEQPRIDCPSGNSITVIAAPGAAGATVDFLLPSASDNCPMVDLTCTAMPGDYFPCGSTFVNCVATDMSGNQVECGFEIIVECPPSVTEGFDCGWTAVTCFSGFINPNNPSLGIADDNVFGIVDNRAVANTPPDGYNLTVPMVKDPRWIRSNLGQVFGLAIDANYNVYLTPTTVYGKFTDPLSGGDITFGPAGPGGVYRINSSDGSITQLVTTNTTTPNTVGLAEIYNTGSGLGNICYDKDYNQLFVTNFTDGKIYRINISTGIVQSTFDHPGSTTFPAAFPSFVDLGERTWGVARYGNRLYYSIWNEDRGRGNLATSNEIWSVEINASGDFVAASEQCEIQLPIYTGQYSCPVSDIAFSETGHMLVAERTIDRDYPSFVGWPAHSSRIWQYSGQPPLLGSCNPVWGTPQLIRIGNYENTPVKHTNSAGGIDYGYGMYDPVTGRFTDCDSIIWGTGDALKFGQSQNFYVGDNEVVYGIAGMSAAGNTNVVGPGYVKTESYYIDLDDPANTSNVSKTYFGDLEVFKCDGCFSSSNTPCDSLMVMLDSTNTDECCFNVDLKNNSGLNISKVAFSLLTSGVVFNFGSLDPAFDLCQSTNQSIVIGNNGGGPIPSGQLNDVFNFCLSNITGPLQTPQKIAVTWYEDIPGTDWGEPVCFDTIMTMCPPIIPSDSCWAIVDDTTYCDPNNPNEYFFKFKVKNLSPFSISQINLYNTSLGYGFIDPTILVPQVPQSNIIYNFPPISSGGTSNEICAKIVAVAPVIAPTQVCFNVSISGQQPPDNHWECCSSEEEFCVTLFPCCDPCELKSLTVKETVMDSCCWSIDIHNNCNIPFFTKIETEILTNGVVFGSHYIGGSSPSQWLSPSSTKLITWEHISGFIPTGTSADVINFCLDDIDFGETPQVVVVRWLTAGQTMKDSVACTDTLTFECEPTEHGCVTILDQSIRCERDSGFYEYTFTFQNTSSPPHSANIFTITPINPATGSIYYAPSSFSFPLLAHGGTLTKTIKIYPLPYPSLLPAGTTIKYEARLENSLDPDHWCCFESDTVCVVIPPCPPAGMPCDSLDFTWRFDNSQPPTGDCCWDVTVVNNYASNMVKFVEVGNVTGATNLSVTASGGWAVSGTGPWQVGPGGFIPTGTFSNQIKVCINGRTAIPQSFPLSFGIVDPANPLICTLDCEETVFADCDIDTECVCDFSEFTLSMGNSTFGLQCNGNAINLECPVNDIFIKGKFLCEDPCETGRGISWKLIHLPSNTMTTGIVPGPNISIGLATALIAQPGAYELILTGTCDGQKCECVLKFNQKCEEKDCTCETFKEDVAKAFDLFYYGSTRSCKRGFTPRGLGLCDQLKWELREINSLFSTLRFTTGNQMAMFNVANGKTYILTIGVTRTLPDGTRCGTIFYRHKFKANCGFPREVCDNSDILNGDFLDDLTGWDIISGEVTHSDDMGCKDEGFVQLAGNGVTQGMISQKLEFDNDPDRDYSLSVCINPTIMSNGVAPPSGSELVIRMAKDVQTGPDCEGDCDEVARIILDTLDWDDDFAIYIPDIAPNLYIHVENAVDDQMTYVGIDNVCLLSTDRVVEDCPSGCADLQADIDVGVERRYYGLVNDCKRSWHPLALNDCDEVRWVLRDITGGEVVKRTIGNDEVLFDLIDGRDYNLIAEVTRTEPDGTTCGPLKYTEEFRVFCGNQPASCPTDLVGNGGFQQGLSGWGTQGNVVEDMGMGCTDVGFIRIGGRSGETNLLEKELNVTNDPDRDYLVSVCLNLLTQESPPEDSRLIIRASNDRQDGLSCTGDCYEVGSIVLDTFIWDCDLAVFMGDLPQYLYFHIENSTDIPLELGIDNVCIREVGTVATQEIAWSNQAQLFPNPTQQMVNISFDLPLKAETDYVMYNLLGRKVAEGQIGKGSKNEQLDLSGQVDGLYLLELRQEGVPVFMNKLVKQ